MAPQVTKPSQVLWTCNLPNKCFALTYRAILILSIVCDKVKEEQGEILENLKKSEGHFEIT